MKFIKASKNEAVKAIYERLLKELKAGKRVLWLVSGGSNIGFEVEIMRLLVKNAADHLPQLAIMPIDERFGKLGHKDSRCSAAAWAGLEPGKSVLVDILIHNLSFDKTVEFYNQAATIALDNAEAVVAQIGMGNDGHVLGIKPDSPACADNGQVVIGYKWDDYQRMTLSVLSMFKKFSVAFMRLPCGADKKA